MQPETHSQPGRQASKKEAFSGVMSLKREATEEIISKGIEESGLSALLEALLANAPVGVVLFDEDLKVISLNQTFSRMTGLSPVQQLGQPLLVALPQTGKIIAPLLKKVLKEGLPITDCEVALQTFSSSDITRWGLLSFYPIPDGVGGACGVATIIVDITDRKRIEKSLRESEDRFRLAVEATKLGTWDHNFQTQKIVWSDQMKDIFELPLDAPVDEKIVASRIHPEDLPRILENIESAKDPESGGDYGVEYRLISEKTRKIHWLASRGKVYRDAKGVPHRFVGTTLDITERKEGEEALTALTKNLTRSNNALDAFARTASHDLKEPLRTVSCFVKLLAERYQGRLDSEADQYIRYIVDGAGRMTHLIESILEFATAGRAAFKSAKVDCAAILDICLKNLNIAAREAKVQITHDPMPTVCGSEDFVLQVFQNLIGNAIKFHAPQNAKVHVGAVRQEKEWLFSVSDNGIGVAPEFLNDIFSPFRRLHSQSVYAGTGLGLAICRQNIERQGGRIWATSEEGKGSTFYFTLPSIREGTT